MTQIDDVFNLVKSLTPSEKRFFRLQSGNGKNYLHVFSAMDSLKEYDFPVLKKKLRNRKMNISYEKNYLQKQIIKSLRAFYSENNSSIELQDILKAIELLYRKRLTTQCEKMVDKGIEICKKYEQWNYNLELIDWKYRINMRKGDYAKLMAYPKEGSEEKQDLVKRILDYSLIQTDIYFVISTFQNQSVYLSKETKNEFREIIKRCEKFLKNGKKDFRIHELLYSTLYLTSHYSGNLKGAYKYSKLNYELYITHPHFKHDFPYKYFVATGNLVTRCISIKKYTEALAYAEELKKNVNHLSSFHAQEINAESRSIMFEWETKILLATDKYPEALKAAKEYERNANTKHLRKNIQLYDAIKFSRIYFANGLLKESLRYTNMVINVSANEMKQDYIVFAHILRMCIQYALKHYDLLEYLSTKLLNFLNRNNIQDQFAFHFIEMIKQIGRTDDREMHKLVFSKYSLLLKKSLHDSIDMDHYTALLNWMKGKQD